MCPFKHFQISIDSEQDRLGCFQLLCLDTMSLYATLLSTSASEDLASNRPLSNVTRGHLRHTLGMLGSRLHNADVQQHDQLIYVISILALVAILFDDQAAVAVHSAGLRRIIALRGGFRALGYSPMLQISLDRINFTGRLLARQWTSLFDYPTPRPPDLPAYIVKGTDQEIASRIKGLVDPELAVVFQSLQQIAAVVNEHYHNGTPVPQIPMQLALEYAHSHLIGLQGRHQGELGECLCLGMMAFLATTICMPDSAFPYYCRGLATDFHYACASVGAPKIEHLPRAVKSWLVIMLLMVVPTMSDNAAISIDWMAEVASRELSWDEARRQLKSVLWLDPFHDALGRRAFGMLKRCCLQW
ncbi:hypothetical protein GQ53DRAFT_519240 [Thozetella sp. PMI_491]|nr:hypothetical protein GQ53DRAFT_519240 [Thozetella sp. PMI_491]